MRQYDMHEFFNWQGQLDANIHALHQVSYETTWRKRILAFLIELGEFANETRCFKFWSFKGPAAKEVILEEYIDGLHFIMSLGIYLHFDATKPVEVHAYQATSLSDALLDVYQKGANLVDNMNIGYYSNVLAAFLGLSALLNFSYEDLQKAYQAKLKINYQRQVNKY